MPDMNEVYEALRKADAAGDTESVQKLAAYIKDVDASAQQSTHSDESLSPENVQHVKGGLSRIGQHLGNVAAGMAAGAGEIGSTILSPLDYAAKKLGWEPEEFDRRKAIAEGLRAMGAEPESVLYKTGKIGTEIAGTAGAGGALGKGISLVAQSPRAVALANALRTGGMEAGKDVAEGVAPAIANMATRMAGGTGAAGAQTAMINPDLKESAMGAGIGAALPPVLKGLGAAGRGVGSAIIRGGEISPEKATLAQKAADLGIDIPADRLANSKIMDAMAASLNYVPFSGRTAAENKMAAQINKAISNTFGEDTSNLNEGFLKRTQEKLGGKFNDFLKNNNVAVDEQLKNDLLDNLTAARQEMGADNRFNILQNQADNLIEKSINGEIQGRAAYDTKMRLDRLAKSPDPSISFHARQIRDSLMKALDRSLSPDDVKAFSELRSQYGNLKTIMPLAKHGSEGEMSLARIGNLKGVRNQELNDIADIAAQFGKGRESPHGAMQRVAMGTMGAGALGGGALVGMLAPVAAGLTAGRGLNALLNSDIARRAVIPGLQQKPPGALSQYISRHTPPNINPEQLMYYSAPVLKSQ